MRKGSITVFFSLLLALFLSFIGSVLEVTRLKMIEGLGEEILYFAEDELLTHYYLPLYERYHIFGLVMGQEEMEQRLKETVESCWEQAGGIDVWSVTAGEAEIEKLVSLDSFQGELYVDQIKQYMKYRILPGEKKSFPEEELREQKEIYRLLSARTKLCEEQMQCSGSSLRLLSCLEGIQTDGHGLKRNRKGLKPEKNFVKQFCPGTATMERTGVQNERIWKTMRSSYYDLPAELNILEQLLRGKDGEPDPAVFASARELGKEAAEALKKLETAKELLRETEQDRIAAEGERKQYIKELETSRDFVEEEKWNVLWEEQERSAGCNLLQTDYNEAGRILDKIAEMLTEIERLRNISETGEMESIILSCREKLPYYEISGLRFSYDNLETERENHKVWEETGETIGTGLLELLYGPEADSVKSLSGGWGRQESGAAALTEIFLEASDSYREITGEILDKFLLGRYTEEHFYSFTDRNKEQVLEYQWEYLVGKENGDRENLLSAGKKILLSRIAVNYIALLLDQEKTGQAEAMARAVAGLTSIEFLIQAVRHLILLTWAAQEGIVEVRALSMGKTISAGKKGSDFKISCEELIQFQEELVREKASAFPDQGPGMGYEDFLRLFFWIQPREQSVGRMLTLSEYNMAFCYDVPFTWSACYMGLTASVSLTAEKKFLSLLGGGRENVRDYRIRRDYCY